MKHKTPDIVFAPTHAGYGNDPQARLKDFLRYCQTGYADGWTCKKKAAEGDLYLFWFGQPAAGLTGFGICVGDVDECENDGWDWTHSRKGWFCTFKPLVALRSPITGNEIKRDPVLARWWKGRCYRGRPKTMLKSPAAGRRLLRLIADRNPRRARLLARYLRLLRR